MWVPLRTRHMLALTVTAAAGLGCAGAPDARTAGRPHGCRAGSLVCRPGAHEALATAEACLPAAGAGSEAQTVTATPSAHRNAASLRGRRRGSAAATAQTRVPALVHAPPCDPSPTGPAAATCRLPLVHLPPESELRLRRGGFHTRLRPARTHESQEAPRCPAVGPLGSSKRPTCRCTRQVA